MDIIESIAITQTRDYLLFFSVIILLLVVYALFKNFKATKKIEEEIKRFSTLTTNTFAKQLNNIENKAFNNINIDQGNFGVLSNILNLYAVSTTDEDGIITYVNDQFCQLSRFSKNELIGKKHKITSSHTHDEKFWKNMWESITKNKVWHGEIANFDIAGNLYWQDTFILPISIFSSNDKGYISLSTDITKIKKENLYLQNKMVKSDEKLQQAESLLLHSEKMSSLGTIAAGIAHEINNPIAFISNNIDKINEYMNTLSSIIQNIKSQYNESDFEQLISYSKNSNADMRELNYILDDYKALLSETLDGVNRVKKIAADLKGFSHKSNDDFNYTNIHQCIDTALNLAKNELKYKAEISKEYAEDIPQIFCDESKISQVMLNLFINASHAIEANGLLTISTVFDHTNIYISIKDNGHGMDKKTQANIFEPFYTTKALGKGTGLGLSLSHDIISLHKGTISVKSQLGLGTEFSIKLPINAHEQKEVKYA
jgi:two-component system NtrC family sensor kinase